MEAYKNRDNIGGYFSYTEDDVSKCIFFDSTKDPKVIGTISFDSTYNIKTAKTDLTERKFSATESDLYFIRLATLDLVKSDTLFRHYNKTSLNLVPLINGDEKKVYILTASSENGVIIFGNDYLLTFGNDNKLTGKKRLHLSLIAMNYGEPDKEGKEVFGAMHTHLPETGDFMTATDICTLMLYEKFTKWKQHNVVSENYLNIWNCLSHQLTVVPMPARTDSDKKKKKN